MALRFCWIAVGTCFIICVVTRFLFWLPGLVQAQPVNQPLVLKDAPREVLFAAHKKFELDCITESGDSSEAKYEWQKYDEPLKLTPNIELSRSRLLFNDPQDDDEGEYRCLASTSAGVASTRPIAIRKAFLNAPKFTSQLVKPVEGKPLKLDCDIPDGYPKPTIEWKKEFNGGKTENVLDGRITIASDGDLCFTNATERDVSKDFKYICVAKSPAVEKEVKLAEYSIDELEKNPNPDNEVVQLFVTPDQHTITAGDRTYLYCIYGSSPQAYPDWYKDGVNVNNKPEDRVTRHNRSKGKRLLIKEVLPEDQGTYTCVINNEVGKAQNYSFYVNVVSAPNLVSKPEKRFQAKEGADVFIPCEVQAVPPSTGSWTYNAKPLANSRASFNEKGLNIKKVEKADAGYYGCLAINEHGEEYVETVLQVA